MSISVGTRVFSISILAIPIINLFDKFINYFKITETFTIVSSMLAILFMIMALLIISTRSLLQRYNCQQYPFYVFSLLCFNSVCCIIIGLELEGLISGFCSTLLKNGDVHLRSAFGAMIFHLNGILVYAISVTIIAAITWNNEFHDTLCYWLGSWYNIVIVFLLGILTGKTGPNWSTLLYLPYIVLPIHMSRNLLGKNDQSQPPIINSPIWRRHIDLSLVIFFISASFMAIFRGIIVLDSPLEPCKWYTRRVEPYLLSTTPAPFAKIQMLLIMFTFTPFYLASIYHLINGTFYKMSESSLIYAGASLSAQVTHFGASVHSRTPYVFRVPSDWDSQAIFWLFNLVLMVGPQIFALRCLQPEDFSSEENANKPFDETVKINGDTPKDK